MTELWGKLRLLFLLVGVAIFGTLWVVIMLAGFVGIIEMIFH